MAEKLEELGDLGTIPEAQQTGVILTGDMFAGMDLCRRGASGDPSSVWYDFADRFRWAVGVAGNHDLFRSGEIQGRNIRLLDGEVAKFDTLRIGGVTGVIGDPRKPNRRPELGFLARLEAVCSRGPNIVVLHESPRVLEHGLVGHPGIAQVLAEVGPALVVSGHAPWEMPLAQVGRVQVLNVDTRAVLLTPGVGLRQLRFLAQV